MSRDEEAVMVAFCASMLVVLICVIVVIEVLMS